MKVIYLGQKDTSIEGMEYLIVKGIDLVVVAPPESPLSDSALRYGVSIITDDELYQRLDDYKGQVDLVISYGYMKRIKKPLIELPKIGCINFHPAPLPEFRGMGGVYNFAIYENLDYWGVSAHFVDESFDTGDLIKVIRFPIDMQHETAQSLKEKSHEHLIMLFKDVIDTICSGEPLPRVPQGNGRYISRKDFEGLRKIELSDSLDEINRKIRAFWCPPYQGAYIKMHGKEFTLVNEELLRKISC